MCAPGRRLRAKNEHLVLAQLLRKSGFLIHARCASGIQSSQVQLLILLVDKHSVTDHQNAGRVPQMKSACDTCPAVKSDLENLPTGNMMLAARCFSSDKPRSGFHEWRTDCWKEDCWGQDVRSGSVKRMSEFMSERRARGWVAQVISRSGLFVRLSACRRGWSVRQTRHWLTQFRRRQKKLR